MGEREIRIEFELYLRVNLQIGRPDDVAFAESDREDLTPDQIKLLAQLMKDITHG